MENLAGLYSRHLSTLQQRLAIFLQQHQLDGLLIHSGQPIRTFLDDRHYPFKVNPHFKAWVPVTQVPNCWLLVDAVNRPKLWFYSPTDYWYCTAVLPDEFWTEQVDIQPLKIIDGIALDLPAHQRFAYIGEHPDNALKLGIEAQNINPQALLDYLHYHRAYKTEYELACLREAQKIAVSGHLAAKEAFCAGMSEFDINMTYLSATGQRDTQVPYDNIVALNEHAAILHYTELEEVIPEKIQSFLLDAGAQYQGYVADITRTYSAKPDNDFAALIKDLKAQQQALISTLKAGVSFIDYHLEMHRRIAGLLKQYQLVRNISEEALVTEGITSLFFPHGLGHLLGLQVHDVAGFMQDEQGTHLAAPAQHPYLRCTRILEAGMVVTIEPGLYFIETLLAPWREHKMSVHFNWPRIDAFKPFGGIRIEDNVVIHEKRVENMTRECFSAA